MRLFTVLLLVTVGPAAVVAQQATATPPRLPLTRPAPVEARAIQPLGNAFGLHVLSDGRVLVNDAIGNRVVLFDSSLTGSRVVVGDGAPTPYGDYGLVLVPAPHDTTLLLDPRSASFLVMDPNGHVVRAIAAPKPADIMMLVALTGIAYLDAGGRLVYRGVRPALPVTPGSTPPAPNDSMPLVRGDFGTRRTDTVGMIRVATSKTRTEPQPVSPANPTGRNRIIPIYNPLLAIDDWNVTSDGTIAIVRASDYHIDWVRMDGSKYSTPKMPFDWRRLSDSDKKKLIDDMRAERERVYARLKISPAYEMVAVEVMDDYMPTVRPNSVRADHDNNLWIPPTTSLDAAPGSLVYDVVNTKGEVTRRVQIPTGRTLVGFGRGGVLYYTAADSAGMFLERARLVAQ